MCGIAGCYQQPDGLALATTMNDRIAHRGPDADGVYRFEDGDVRAYLAHRRLSIIDLSSGADQPFSKRGLTISYNGELYNYKELRAELARSGVAFRTHSDTEVVLEAWRRWGPAALSRFRGMFAFAMLDEDSGSLFLARDPLGIKPLYFHRRHGGVIFASELKALVAAIGPELRTDPGALIASMLYYWLPEQRCAIEGVEKLPPGSWAEFRPDGTSRHETYWRVTEVATEAAAGPPADLRSVIEESVAAHLVADVGVSTFLSGGLDSSLVTVLAKRLDPGIDSYTITFRAQDQRLEAMPDDAIYARKVAQQFGIDLHEIEIAPDVVDLLPRIVDVLDEPIGDPAAINTLLMCDAARDAGVKVLLSGMGADELFGGYRKHLACVMGAQYQRLPGVLRNGLVGPAVRRLPVTANGRGLRYARWAKRFLTFADLPEETAFRRSYTMYDADQLAGLLSPDLEPYVGKLIAEHSDIYHDTTLDDHVNRMCLADARMFLPGLNLAYTDRSSMAASTEVRTPFVDPVVARAAFSIPGSEKIHRRQGKLALKKAAEAWLPREIIYRPKASFSAPLRAWVRNDLRELVDDVLLRGELVGSGFLQQAAVQRLVDDERAGREDYSKQIWQLLTLETWSRHMRSLGVTITSL
ncbi:asparagine synthase (glutamine-hydrolyzing) [Kribbella sp. CA-247076]|uniref:asparagine synthase (glutamine-hydrolyzing) n=1 Tax=Kribbella sp. CA-247076 TaxID=3239941 RepID=UPI003D9453FD